MSVELLLFREKGGVRSRQIWVFHSDGASRQWIPPLHYGSPPTYLTVIWACARPLAFPHQARAGFEGRRKELAGTISKTLRHHGSSSLQQLPTILFTSRFGSDDDFPPLGGLTPYGNFTAMREFVGRSDRLSICIVAESLDAGPWIWMLLDNLPLAGCPTGLDFDRRDI